MLFTFIIQYIPQIKFLKMLSPEFITEKQYNIIG